MEHDKLVQQLDCTWSSKLQKNIYTKYDMLAIATNLTDKYEFKKATKMLSIANETKVNDNNKQYYDTFGTRAKSYTLLEQQIKIDYTFDNLYENAMYYTYNKYNNYDLEYYLYEPIQFYITDLIENSVVIEHVIINRKIPDIFLRVNGIICVGEIKPRTFTKKNIEQLENYMRVYNCTTGYAFAKELTGTINANYNIIFIDITGIKDKYYKSQHVDSD